MAGRWQAEGAGLKLDGFVLPIGLTLDEVIVSGHDVVVDTEPFSIHLGRDASAVVRVSCESIANFLGSLKLGLRDVSVSTFEGQLKIGATAVVLVPIRATALCSLAVRDGKALDIVLHSAEPSAARGLIEKQLAGINPVLDLSTLPLDLVIEGVEIEDGWVEVRATGETRANAPS